MNDEGRATARDLAEQHIRAGDPLGWFEALYARASGDAAAIPWADLAPNPNLVEWLDHGGVEGQGRKALKVGCGLGDDAEELARRGFATTAFDVSATAIDWCRKRFPGSPVTYVVADLLRPPSVWRRAFDFVVESYTLQVLPAALRADAIHQVASFVATSGTLLVIARGREPDASPGAMPWPLTAGELAEIERLGLERVGFEDYVDREDPPVRRFRAAYRRPERP